MHLFVYCAGGFGMEVMDVARRLDRRHGRWQGIAFLDDARREPIVYGAEVLCLGDALGRFGAADMEAVIANGEPFVRKVLAEKLEAGGVRLATLVDDTAVVSDTARVGPGAIVFPQCFVSSHAVVGDNVAIVAGSMIGHHASIGDNCVVAGHVNVGGDCRVGSETYLGMGSQIRNLVQVGCGSVVGMGSIVFANIPDEVIALGNPCRPMRPNTEKRVFR